MKLSLNKEYAKRHLFVTIVMAGLGCWFAYDGFIRYPHTPAAELYRSIEGSDAPETVNLEAFKAQKTQTQYGFTVLAFLAALVVGGRLLKSARFAFDFDDAGFTANGKRFTYADISRVDRAQWEKKGIIRLHLASGESLTLDAWHHTGVKDFAAKIG